MSNDLTVQAAATVRVGNDIAGGPKVAAPQPPVPQAPAASASQHANPNPTLRLDLALGLVVIEFHNSDGTVTTSIPTQRQLEAYRRWETTPSGQAPAGAAQARAVVGKSTAQPQPGSDPGGDRGGSSNTGGTTIARSTARPE